MTDCFVSVIMLSRILFDVISVLLAGYTIQRALLDPSALAKRTFMKVARANLRAVDQSKEMLALSYSLTADKSRSTSPWEKAFIPIRATADITKGISCRD